MDNSVIILGRETWLRREAMAFVEPYGPLILRIDVKANHWQPLHLSRCLSDKISDYLV